MTGGAAVPLELIVAESATRDETALVVIALEEAVKPFGELFHFSGTFERTRSATQELCVLWDP